MANLLNHVKIDVNGESSEELEINAGICQSSLLDTTIFLLYIKDLPKNMPRSVVNIYYIWYHGMWLQL